MNVRYVTPEDHWLFLGIIFLGGWFLVWYTWRWHRILRVLCYVGGLLSLVPLLWALISGSIVIRRDPEVIIPRPVKNQEEVIRVGSVGMPLEEEMTPGPRLSKKRGWFVCAKCGERTLLASTGSRCNMTVGCGGSMWMSR